jgi:pimeloyl-ACP methyl ester carboxylesterase
MGGRGIMVPTEVFGMASNQPSQLQVLFIPGNPGSASYFQRQIQLLSEAMGGNIDVQAVTHAGHESSSGQLPLFSLQDQIKHKIAFIRQNIDSSRPLVVIGHSIGAFIACSAIQQLGEGGYNIRRVLCVFPFFWLEHKPPWKVRGLSIAASFYGTMGGVAGFLALAPQSARRFVIKAFTKTGQLDPQAIETTASLLSASSVKQNFFMGHTEFQAEGGLRQPPPLELLRSLAPRLTIFGCPEDDWMSKQQYDFIRTQVPDAKYMWIEDARHAFVTNEVQNRRVCQEIVREIQEELQHSSPTHYIKSKL